MRAERRGRPARDLRLASFDWFQPSVVFYTGREVKLLDSPAAIGVPGGADAGFLFVPDPCGMSPSPPGWRPIVSWQDTTISWRSAISSW